MIHPLMSKLGKVPLLLALIIVPSFLSAQLCEDRFVWKNHIGVQLPDDVSYSTVRPNPLMLGNQMINIYNSTPNGGASSLNNTIRRELLGGVSDSYVLSLDGANGNLVKFKIVFIAPVSNIYFNLLDIDKHSQGFWQDSLVIRAYSGANQIAISSSNILFQGPAVRFDDTIDALMGVSTVNNPNGSDGNINFLFTETIDSILIDYGYGADSDNNMLGNQIIGIDIINFSSQNSCEDPKVTPDEVCTEFGSSMVALDPLANDIEGGFPFDRSTLNIMSQPSNGMASISSDYLIEYTPNAAYKGKDELTYQVCDQNGTCVSAIIEYIVRGDASVFAMNDAITLLSNTSVSSSVLTNDFDTEGDALMIDMSSIVYPTNGVMQLQADGTISYTPNADFSGTDIAKYTICKQSNTAICNQAEIHFYVQSVILPGVSSFIDIAMKYLCINWSQYTTMYQII